MKRSDFLKSLATVFAAPSLLATKDNPKIETPPKVQKQQQLVKVEDIRLGDFVLFENMEVGLCTAMVMGCPQFRPTKRNAELKGNFKLLSRRFQE